MGLHAALVSAAQLLPPEPPRERSPIEIDLSVMPHGSEAGSGGEPAPASADTIAAAPSPAEPTALPEPAPVEPATAPPPEPEALVPPPTPEPEAPAVEALVPPPPPKPPVAKRATRPPPPPAPVTTPREAKARDTTGAPRDGSASELASVAPAGSANGAHGAATGTGSGGEESGAGGSGDAGAPLVRPPRFLNRDEMVRNLRRYYPEKERRDGHESTVVVMLHINTEGIVPDIDIVQSGGVAFDAAARKIAQRMRFAPASGRDGPIAVKLRQEIIFRLEPLG